MDPRIRIRIHPKMSWIRSTGSVKEVEKLGELFIFLRQVFMYTTLVILLTPNLLDFIRPLVSSPPIIALGGMGWVGGGVSKVTATTAGWMVDGLKGGEGIASDCLFTYQSPV
jgi:hypothetical protein